jgi:cytochrome c553
MQMNGSRLIGIFASMPLRQQQSACVICSKPTTNGTRMKRAIKNLGYLVVALTLAIATLICTAWVRSESAFATVHPIATANLQFTGDAEQLQRGRHLSMTRGCTDCHGEDLAGRKIVDEQPLGRIYGANLTLLGERDAAEIERAIRQGLRSDGRSLLLMPTIDYTGLSDSDTAALIAYLQSLPPKGGAMPATALGVLPRVLWLFDKFPLVSHEQIKGKEIVRAEQTPAPTVEYGAYVAQVCQGCHNTSFSGGPMAGAPPETPDPANLTPHANGLIAWTETDFIKAMRTGLRPDGRSLNPLMPWQTFARMTDVELQAMWRYLQTLPPREKGARG